MLQLILFILQVSNGVFTLIKDIIGLFKNAPQTVQEDVKQALAIAMMAHRSEPDVALLTNRLKEIVDKLRACN